MGDFSGNDLPSICNAHQTKGMNRIMLCMTDELPMVGTSAPIKINYSVVM